MKSISILGCGWLGMALAKDLVKVGYRVLGSTTQQPKLDILRNAGIEPFLIHFNPQLVADNASEFFEADIIVITIPPRRKSGLTDVYLQQIESIMQKLSLHTTRKIIFISSTSVYPDTNGVVKEEDADPESYLFKAEKIISAAKEFKATILRFGGLIGPDRNPGRFLSGKKDVAGGSNPVNIIHQQDCIAIIKKIINDNIWGEVFNACSDRHPTKKEYYSEESTKLNLEPPHFLANDHSPFKIVSNEKLKRMLNYQFIY
jgi:nucleoside-diphosphate-sugar epimerase